MALSPSHHAETLLAQGRVAEALQVARDAAFANDPAALALLATWIMVGKVLKRDLPHARRLLRAAADLGHVDAALLEIALVANGSGGASDWRGAKDLLESAARADPIAAEHLALVDSMALDEDGSPLSLPSVERLSISPDVVLYRALLTSRECRHIMDVAQASLAPAVVIHPSTGKSVTHPFRTSHDALIGPARETLAIRAINCRLAAASGTQPQQGEPLAVLRYTSGQQYRPHFDTIGGAANQRIKTALVYLNDGYSGGETQFLADDLKVAGKTGDVLLFGNVLGDGSADPRSQHAGLPVQNGAKWLATRWIRAAPYDPWSAS